MQSNCPNELYNRLKQTHKGQYVGVCSSVSRSFFHLEADPTNRYNKRRVCVVLSQRVTTRPTLSLEARCPDLYWVGMRLVNTHRNDSCVVPRNIRT